MEINKELINKLYDLIGMSIDIELNGTSKFLEDNRSHYFICMHKILTIMHFIKLEHSGMAELKLIELEEYLNKQSLIK